jgi:hypothetical protein
MPAKLERCVEHVKASNRGKPKSKRVNPWAVCIASTGLKPHRRGRKR